MGARIQVAVAGLLVGCLLAGCATERTQPATWLPASWYAENPCADLQPVRNIRPYYPRAAAAHEQQGWVALKYHVAANGAVFNVRVVASSPQGLFDDASAAALTRWRYEAMSYPVRNCTHVDVYTLGPEPAPTTSEKAGSFAAFETIPARE